MDKQLAVSGRQQAGVAALMLTVLALTAPLPVQAHAEHDKARYVATDGKDAGRCDQPLRPCQSIAYAVQQANKGDRVLVAAGHYQLTDDEQLFYFSSDLVPVLGGYSRIDHYQLQAPDINRTLLSGIPLQWQEEVSRRGFHLIRDGKAQLSDSLALRLLQHQSLSNSQTAQQCVNGKAGNFSCHNIDLVAHMALADFSSQPSSANDIWGHVDLNSGTEYALIGLRNGTAVVSLADPQNPVEVGTIAGSSTTWRDIKVYQYFDRTLRRWQAYAYVSSEGSDGIQIIDLTRLPSEISLAATYNGVTSTHNIYISGVDYSSNSQNSSTAPLLHLAGQNTQRGAVSSLSLANPTALVPLWQQQAVAGDYSHDVASMQIDDARALSDCQQSPCQILFDFNEQDVRLWDSSVPASPSQLARFSYDQVAYVHSGWSSEDNRFLFVHDELDESSFALNTTLRIYALDDLRNPVLQPLWRGPTLAIDHNGFVRGNRYYMSNYQRGLTILDITNPAAPTEAGFFDTFLPSDGAAFNGMWGTYPFLPSGLILGSDINSGLYILADNTKAVAAGALSFTNSTVVVAPGEVAQLRVQRPQGVGEVSVAYHTFAGSALPGSDYETSTGRLSWAANDNSDKTLSVTTLDSGEVSQRTVLVRLYDVQGGATLAAPAMAVLGFGIEPPRPGSLSLVQSAVQATEGDSVTITVQRIGGSSGALSVQYQTQDGSASAGADYSAASAQLDWADADSSDKTIMLTVIDDALQESDETFSVQLLSVAGSVVGPTGSLVVTILDNDSNTAPQVNAGENRQVNAGQTVTLSAAANDAEGDTISYQWQQISGPAVTLQNAASASASFVAPATSSSLTFRVTATDNRGASSSDDISIAVVAAGQNNAVNSGSGGGSSSPFALLVAALLCWRRQVRQACALNHSR
ncbi:MAG: choice-of-anchor B family protein [Gammaproteobacteria bacterium]|nr:choice-of-anchor B family protein [Gammaproteobacteria bacterium]MBU1556419.1 choice-of-anchor B family protein [Gammaproteobacteria bacterium]MBU2071997.1 choice-of-anchor B family protein [Gammaproteobacteria bacterium]MBU2183918.1 choice-of-anchor B family protein [Gammaproteobacteria bacterium]MBU2203328.1 choice-of-anchor B family protein [Gammaproteobacteria bacterium]